MRIEEKKADISVPLGQMVCGSVYRSTATGLVYIAGTDSDGEATITCLSTGKVWYSTSPPGLKFTPVTATVVITAG